MTAPQDWPLLDKAFEKILDLRRPDNPQRRISWVVGRGPGPTGGYVFRALFHADNTSGVWDPSGGNPPRYLEATGDSEIETLVRFFAELQKAVDETGNPHMKQALSLRNTLI